MLTKVHKSHVFMGHASRGYARNMKHKFQIEQAVRNEDSRF